jgi:hypothetical protein
LSVPIGNAEALAKPEERVRRERPEGVLVGVQVRQVTC